MTPADADQNAQAGQGIIELAAVRAFRIGALEVRPPTREVIGPEAVIIAEPRVLHVLIALCQANGAVVSRDQLIARCWEGRIVGEDAINRSISKARALADLATPPAFVIETIPRVGYRLQAGAAEAETSDATVVPVLATV